MKPLYKISAGLIAISIGLSLKLFLLPVNADSFPHWAIPLGAIICLVILMGAERGPKPKNPERGFWAILLGLPILAILFQLYYLADSYEVLAFFGHKLVPTYGFHIFLAIIGNYVTTSKSMMSGIPTPWNLRSDLSWRKSHRLMGFGMVVLAAVSAIITLITGVFQVFVMGGGLAISLISFVIYSWWVWREDPDRRPLMGTS